MKSVGNLLKEARLKKRRTKSEVARETRIKESFVEAIEKGQWQILPEFPIVNGFVKAIANYLDVDSFQAMALLRRDYPPTSKPLIPKNPKRQFIWGPRLTFLLGVAVIFLIIVGYLGFQYKKFISPPTLMVDVPKDGQVVKLSLLKVTGKTDPDATIIINNQPVLVTTNGSFSAELEVSKNTGEIIITARSRSGKESIVHRKITPQI